jgi:hypothetical protein
MALPTKRHHFYVLIVIGDGNGEPFFFESGRERKMPSKSTDATVTKIFLRVSRSGSFLLRPKSKIKNS